MMLDVCRSQAGVYIKSVRSINALKLTQSDLTDKIGSHTSSSADTSYTHDKHLDVIPVDTNGWCVVAKEIKTRAPYSDNNRPSIWSCKDQCKLLTSLEVDLVLKMKGLLTMPVVDIREALDRRNLPHPLGLEYYQ